jgi:hypothetical protein
MRQNEIKEWIKCWDDHYANLDEIYDFDFAWSIHEHAKGGRILIEELQNTLKVYTHMTLAMVQDMHPTLTPEQKAEIREMYFDNAVSAIQE